MKAHLNQNHFSFVNVGNQKDWNERPVADERCIHLKGMLPPKNNWLPATKETCHRETNMGNELQIDSHIFTKPYTEKDIPGCNKLTKGNKILDSCSTWTLESLVLG